MRFDRFRCALLVLVGTGGLVALVFGDSPNLASDESPPSYNARVGRGDWPQLGGTPHRNNAPECANVPTEWNFGKFDRKTGEWQPATARNIKWANPLGSHTNGNPVVANGQVYVGTNNGHGYLKRYSRQIDLDVLLCFRESNGDFLWQYSGEKHPTGRRHDRPMHGLSSSPVVEGDRLWFVSNRGEVICLDAEGFRDDENDGPYTTEEPDKVEIAWDAEHEADIVWKFDMMEVLGVRQHEMATCSPTIWGDVLFVCTSNGVDLGHVNIPAPDAPSFIAMDKRTGKVLWTDNSPGKNILHTQWSSPAVGVFAGVPQVLFAGGDGWLYSFRADRWSEAQPELLWKFDGNPKASRYDLYGRATRNEIIAVPTIYDGCVYLAMGGDPEHGEGEGHLWCIDPTKRGDVSAELVVDQHGKTVPHQRFQATARIGQLEPTAIPNPNSAVVWHYDQFDRNENGKIDFEEKLHRTIGSPVIKNNLLVIADFGGLVHCLQAKTGTPYWTCDLQATCWATSLIAGDNVYVVDEDGDVAIFALSPDPGKSVETTTSAGAVVHKPLREINMHNSVYTMPVVANNVLYIAAGDYLFAIAAETNGRSTTGQSD